jgi:hypothetical protein
MTFTSQLTVGNSGVGYFDKSSSYPIGIKTDASGGSILN